MAKGHGGGTLGDVKGGNALADLLKKMLPARPHPPQATSQPVITPTPASKAAPEDLALAMARKARTPQSPTAMAKAAIAATKAKSNKEVIKLPRHLSEEAVRQTTLPVRTDGSRATKSVVNDLGAAAYQRIVAMRPSLDSFISDTRAPALIDEATKKTIERRIAMGAAAGRDIADPNADGYIGHDFGTSTTKAVARWPYDRSLGAFSIPVPPGWCSGGVPHLWPTVLYFDQASLTFSPLPTDGLVPLTGFKSALIEGNAHRTCCGTSATMADAATAFLALHLAYVVGAITEVRPGAGISAINIGVPVAALADKTAAATFANIGRAAILLLDSAASLTLDQVREALIAPSRGAIPFELHTELSGAIAGYCAGPRRHQGSHMIIDCGSATLDFASFHLGDARWPVGIYAAEVSALGADACVAYEAAGAPVADCRNAVRYSEHSVFARTLGYARSGFSQDDDRHYTYQVITIGGGIDGPIHQPLLKDMASSFQRPFHRPELDPELECEDERNAGRLILADGLARSPIELREVAMPGDRPPSPSNGLPEIISKDQV